MYLFSGIARRSVGCERFSEFHFGISHYVDSCKTPDSQSWEPGSDALYCRFEDWSFMFSPQRAPVHSAV